MDDSGISSNPDTKGNRPPLDFRGYMQDYARDAIKAGMFVNGGAVVVILAQLEKLVDVVDPIAIQRAVYGYSSALGAALATSVVAFMAARLSARISEDKFAKSDVKKVARSASRLTNLGLGLMVLSIALFFAASILLAMNMKIDLIADEQGQNTP